jgi:H-type lectin domain
MMNSNLQPWRTLSATVSAGTFSEGWTLADLGESGESRRCYSLDISFEGPFSAPPVVQVALSGFDIDQGHTARLSVRALNITTEGFKLEIDTWADTVVYGVECAWLAIGA